MIFILYLTNKMSYFGNNFSHVSCQLHVKMWIILHEIEAKLTVLVLLAGTG